MLGVRCNAAVALAHAAHQRYWRYAGHAPENAYQDRLVSSLLQRATLLGMLLVAAVPAYAQEFPRWEAFGGFSYAKVNLGPQAGLFVPTNRNYYGIDLVFNFNPYKNIRLLLIDFAVQQGGTNACPSPCPFKSISVLTSQSLFGPQFTVRRRKATIFGNGLVGVTNTRLVAALGGGLFDDLVRRTNLALAFGGGLDVNWKRRIAIRLFQADYIPTRLADTWEKHYSVSTGVVFKFDYRIRR